MEWRFTRTKRFGSTATLLWCAKRAIRLKTRLCWQLFGTQHWQNPRHMTLWQKSLHISAKLCRLESILCLTGQEMLGHLTLWSSRGLDSISLLMDGAVVFQHSKAIWKRGYRYTKWFATIWPIWFVSIALQESFWTTLIFGKMPHGQVLDSLTKSSWTWIHPTDSLHGLKCLDGAKSATLRTKGCLLFLFLLPPKQESWKKVYYEYVLYAGLLHGVPHAQDLLHTLHQGVSLCAIAGLLTDHFNSKHPGQTLAELERCLYSAYRHYRGWCKSKGLPASSVRFNLNRFGRESWQTMPELTTQYKASTVKYMQYWLHDFLMSEPAVPDSDNRRNCSYALAMFQFMLDTHSEWFEQDQANRTAEYGYSFLLFYQALAVRSRGELRNNYKIVPKFHYFFHLQEYIETTLRNPRLVVSKNIHPCVSKLTVLSGGGVLVGTKLMPKGMFFVDKSSPQFQVRTLLPWWILDGSTCKNCFEMSCFYIGEDLLAPVPSPLGLVLGFRASWRATGLIPARSPSGKKWRRNWLDVPCQSLPPETSFKKRLYLFWCHQPLIRSVGKSTALF